MSTFEVTLSFKGQTFRLEHVNIGLTARELYDRVKQVCNLNDEDVVKVLYKGKVLRQDDATAVFPIIPDKPPKLIVMASANEAVKEVQSRRPDATIRGFDNERKTTQPRNTVWGPKTGQDAKFKFVKLEACTWQSFGTRAGEQTPHAFVALQLLEKLATDPGIVAIMRDRQLVVNTLGEMDPIDDRLKQKKEAHGACLLGYNTNHGLRIDIRLRTFDLKSFLPYPDLVSTLIHELSHNWMGEHGLLFWGNFAQMRVEYLHTHASLAASGYVVDGKSCAHIAGVMDQCKDGMAGIANAVMAELAAEMPQYGLSPQLLATAVVDRCQQLTETNRGLECGRTLGGSDSSQPNARAAALAAAEKRAREHLSSNRQGEEKPDRRAKPNDNDEKKP